MSALADIQTILTALSIPSEVGYFSTPPGNTYCDIVPIIDLPSLNCSDAPERIIESVRISLYTKGNYKSTVNSILTQLLSNGFCISQGKYVEYENDTKYHHYAIDVEKDYEWPTSQS